MSADNFVVIRKFPDGYRWASLGASQWWHTDKPYPDEVFRSKAFPTEEAAMDNAEDVLPYIEYGFEADRKPE